MELIKVLLIFHAINVPFTCNLTVGDCNPTPTNPVLRLLLYILLVVPDILHKDSPVAPTAHVPPVGKVTQPAPSHR